MSDEGNVELPKGPIIDYVLSKLMDISQDIDAAIVAGYEGLLFAAKVRDIEDPESIGAVSSLILDNSTRMIGEFNQGKLTEMLVLGTEGYTLLKNIGEAAFLTVTSKKYKIERATYQAFLRAAKALEIVEDQLV